MPTIARISIAYSTGIALVVGWFISPAATFLLVAALIAAFVAADEAAVLLDNWQRNSAFLLAGVLLGHNALDARVHDCRNGLRDGARYTVDAVLLEAVEKGSTPIELRRIGGAQCHGQLRMLAPFRAQALAAGSGVRITATWSRDAQAGPLAVGAGILLAEEISANGMRAKLPAARGRIVTRIRALFGAEAPLAEALLVAQQDGIDPDVKQDFAASGLAHLLAISGSHVALVAAVLVLLTALARLPVMWGNTLGAAGAIAYVLFLGAPYPAARAALQIAFVLGSRALQRPSDPIGLLASAAFFILLYDPLALFDIGFQLSFAGLAAIVLWRKPLLAWTPASLPHVLRDAIATSTAATLATTPLCAFHFAQVSLIAVPANLLALPLVSLSVPAAAFALAISPLNHAAAQFIADGARLVLARLADTAALAAAVPGGHLFVTRPTVVAGGAALIIGWVLLRRLWPLRPAFRLGASCALAIAVVLTTAPALRQRDSHSVEIHIIDVGQGDAVAVRSPAGQWLLIDAGPRSDRYNAGARRVVPFLLRHGARKLEALVLTHPHLDHIGGAAAVASVIEPKLVIDPDSGRFAARQLEGVASAVGREHGQWLRAQPGMRIRFDEVDIEVLHPSRVLLDAAMDPNDYSVVLRLGYGKFSAVFMGDAPVAVEDALAARNGRQLDVDLLKVGHHGSSTSTGASWLALTTPRYAVISVGRGNRYGHPSRVVLNRLDSADVKTLRTDLEGTISFRAYSDGRIERITRP